MRDAVRPPQVRLVLQPQLVASVRRLPASSRDAILGGISREILVAAEQGPGLRWVPARHNFAFVAVLGDVLGEAETEAMFRELFLSVWGSELFRNVAQAAYRVAGRDPGAYLRFIPRGLPLPFRDYGEVRNGASSTGRHAVTFDGWVSEVFDHDARWLRCAAASQRSIFDFLGVDGTAELVNADAGRGFAEFHYAW